MSFQKIENITTAIAEKLESLGIFKKVVVAAATNGGQLWDILESMTSIPCAVVCVGTVDYDEKCVSRTVRPLIFIADKFQRGEEAKAKEIWRMAEAVVDCFVPVFKTQTLADYPEYSGIELTAVSITPIDGKENIAAYAITLEGTDYIQRVENI